MALYAFDGTWNNEKDAGRYDLNTNVVRFKDLYTGRKFFYQGVGTRHGLVGKIVGGAFGVGGHDRIEEAKRDLARQLAEGGAVSAAHAGHEDVVPEVGRARSGFTAWRRDPHPWLRSPGGGGSAQKSSRGSAAR